MHEDKPPALRTMAMPCDANPDGDMFGGWLLSQMDIAGGMTAFERAKGRIVTVGIEAMKFHLPVLVGDEISCYADVIRVGKTSIRIRIDSWVKRRSTGEMLKVTEGVFTYVAIDDHRQPRPVE